MKRKFLKFLERNKYNFIKGNKLFDFLIFKGKKKIIINFRLSKIKNNFVEDLVNDENVNVGVIRAKKLNDYQAGFIFWNVLDVLSKSTFNNIIYFDYKSEGIK